MDKKTMDFYNGLDASSRDHSKVTKQHFGDRKYALITALIFALLADAFLLVELILTTGQVKYYIAPILIIEPVSPASAAFSYHASTCV